MTFPFNCDIYANVDLSSLLRDIDKSLGSLKSLEHSRIMQQPVETIVTSEKRQQNLFFYRESQIKCFFLCCV